MTRIEEIEMELAANLCEPLEKLKDFRWFEVLVDIELCRQETVSALFAERIARREAEAKLAESDRKLRELRGAVLKYGEVTEGGLTEMAAFDKMTALASEGK